MTKHDGLLDRTLGNADGEVNDKKFPPPEFAFHYKTEAPKEDHIADQMRGSHVDKVAGDPLDRMQAVAMCECSGAPLIDVLHRSPACDEKYEAVHDDHRDAGKWEVIDRGVGVEWDQQRVWSALQVGSRATRRYREINVSESSAIAQVVGAHEKSPGSNKPGLY